MALADFPDRLVRSLADVGSNLGFSPITPTFKSHFV